MTRHVWRAADAGVMLWEPAAEATTTIMPHEPYEQKQLLSVTEADIQASLANDDSDEQDLVLPPIEDIFGTYIKSEPMDDHLITPPESSRYTLESTLPLSSPCPVRINPAFPIGFVKPTATSHHSDPSATERKLPVRRTLDFGMVTVRNTPDVAPQDAQRSDFGSLVALRNLERDPPHQWDEDERELLTILYRFYDDKNVTTIPKTFNAITRLNLRLHVIRYQFESHLLLYGGRAYPEFGRVLAVPFHDPDGRYDDIRTIIEETALEHGIDLLRRKFEVKFKSGSAQHAKSPRTRKIYKSLVKRAVKREKEKARALLAPAVEEAPVPVLQLGGMTLAANPTHENEEIWSDIDDSHASPVIPTGFSQRVPLSQRTIAFRVWDANSRTMFDEEAGFVSQAFSIWRGQFPPPFSPEGQGQQALMLLTNLHLSMSGGASAFVSVSTSLLQALVKASTMNEPRIAVVALDHPLLQEAHKTLPAADVMRMLKTEGQAWWARYKGHAERMIWASLPAAAVISHFPISDLRYLSNRDPACENVLNLDDVQSGRKTQYVSSLLREKNNVINIVTARAMALICRTFGMHSEGASLSHIQGLVASLVDSFQITAGPTNDFRTSSKIAKSFALSLKSQVHFLQDVEAAFVEGVEQGLATIAFFTRRRPAASRRRSG